MTRNKKFAPVEHTSDLGLQVWGKDLKELFLNASEGLLRLMLEPDTVRPARKQAVKISAANAEELLVSWLERPVFLLDADEFVCAGAEISRISETELEGSWLGEDYTPARHVLRQSVKAVTYHDLEIKKGEDRLTVTIIFDV